MSSNQFSIRFLDLNKKITDDEYLATLSLQELISLRKEAKEAESEYKNLELVVKKDANSLYGTTGSEHFSMGDYDVAEDITQTGKHYAVIVDVAINNFFKNWGETELKIIQEFYPNVKALRQNVKYSMDNEFDVCVYGDTDSRYIDVGIVYDLMGFSIPPNTPEGNQELADFGIFMGDKFINKVIKETIDEDLEFRNATKGRLKMAHEVTTRISIFQRKKKYVMNVIWKDGKTLLKPELKYVGVELKKGEFSAKIKKIIQVLLEKFLEEKITDDEMRIEMIKLIKYIKNLKNKEYICKVTSVSGLKLIQKKVENNKNIWYNTENKNHIQMQIALSWYNFLEEYGLINEYQRPFEKQKMYYYYYIDKFGDKKVIGIPDDVEVNDLKNLPEPDWDFMLKETLVKSMLKYIKNYDTKDITPEKINNFLLGIKEIEIN